MRRSRCWVPEYSTCLFSAAEAASSVRTRRECGRGRGMRWMMQNGKEADRLLTVPSVHITLATTSVFTTKEGQVKASNCYWISLSGNLHSCSVSWTLVLASVWKERGQVEISIFTNRPTHTQCSAPLLQHHVVPFQQFVYSSLSTGQQNGHLPSACVLLAAVPTLSLMSHLGSLSHATWEEVLPSIIDYADWVGKPMHMALHRQTLVHPSVH